MPFMKTNDLSLYYHCEGNGIPIMFIHPPLLTSTNFAYQKQLAQRFRLITFDIRGHGYSDFSSTALTYSVIIDDMIQLLDYLDIEACYVCGYSTGGTIALEAMFAHPHRFYGGILVSAMSEVSDWWLRARISAAVSLTELRFKRCLSLAISSGNADKMTTFWRLYRDAKQGDVDNMKQYYSTSKGHNCTGKLQDIALPQLLIYGEKDKGFHRYANILAQQLPHNEFYIIKDKSHQIPTKAPHKMNQLIRNWINKQSRPN